MPPAVNPPHTLRAPTMSKHKLVTDDTYEEALKLFLKASLLIAPTKDAERDFKQLAKFGRIGGLSAETTTRRLIAELNKKLTTGVWF